jgi:predicted homoserine dehydrogenase-like protein
MSLYKKLQQRAHDSKPIRIALIGAGKFGSMYLSQIPRTPGIHLVGIADLLPDRAQAGRLRLRRQHAKALPTLRAMQVH